MSVQLWTSEYEYRSAARVAPSKLPAKSQFLPPDGDDAQLILPVVIDRQTAVVDVALQGVPLIGEIPHGIAERRLGQRGRGYRVAHGVDFCEQGHGVLLPARPAGLGRHVGGRVLDLVVGHYVVLHNSDGALCITRANPLTAKQIEE